MATSRSNVTRLKVGLLGASIAWTDAIQDRFANEYMIRRVRAEAYATVAGTLYLKESDAADMSSATTLQTISVSASVTIELPWTLLTKRYYRLEYTNGAAAQTALMELFMERSGRPLDDVYVPDGYDVGLGATDAAAATAGGTGTVSGKLRKISADVNVSMTSIGPTVSAIADAGGVGATNAHLRRVTDTLGQQDGAAIITDAAGRVQQYLRGLVKLIAEGTGKIAVSGSNLGKAPSDSKTRPDNVTPYTAGDVVGDGTNLEFTNVSGTAGGLVAIMKAMLRINIAALPTGMAGFKLHLFDTAPTPLADNAAFTIIEADWGKYLGWVTILTPEDLGAVLVGKDDGSRDVFKLASASTTFYGQLQTLGGFTPAAGLEVYVMSMNTAEV